ncbi:MAG: DMT family transporter [Rhodospirillales bacterium]|jgi:drug/metabolite transporter, DME family|nr:DMT family transporter [Rhodospirillales bacterium]
MSVITVDEHKAEMRGRMQVLLAGMLWSLGSLFIRLTEEATTWHIVGYRGYFLVLFLLGYIAWKRRGDVVGAFRESGLLGFFAGLSVTGAFIGFVFSISHTTAAQALLMLSVAPFLAAILGLIILKEVPRRATWVCMTVAGAGVLIMVRNGVEDGSFIGALYGLMAAMCFAVYTIILRLGRTRDMMPAVCTAGFLSGSVGFIALYVTGIGFMLPLNDVVMCAGMGFIHLGMGLVIFTIGSKTVSAAELPLLCLTEVVFGPIWVWMAVGEMPPNDTLIGGGVVLLAVVGNALSGIRRKHPPIGIV